jgi:hypothetical protein
MYEGCDRYERRVYRYCSYCPQKWLLFNDGSCPVCERIAGYPADHRRQPPMTGKVHEMAAQVQGGLQPVRMDG